MTKKWSGFVPQNQLMKERWRRLETRWAVPRNPERIRITVREGKTPASHIAQELVALGLHEDN